MAIAPIIAGNLMSFKASLGIARAKEACRTAGTLWIAEDPNGHGLICGHLALLLRNKPPARFAV